MSEIDPARLAAAAKILRSGGIVAFATETVYGLGADATNADAIHRIYAAKGRPPTNPLIVHVSHAQMAREYTAAWPAEAEKLSRSFWPGPLTMVLPRGPRIVPLVSAGLATIGVRAPKHPLAQALLQTFGGPIAAPSANRSNHISPTSAEHVRSELGASVDMILDGGSCEIGIESTVVDVSGSSPKILRPGSITREQIENVIGTTCVASEQNDTSGPASSPGQQKVHYAPCTPAFRFETSEAGRVKNFLCAHPEQRTAIIVRNGSLADQLLGGLPTGNHRLFRAPSHASAYAHDLYAMLRQLDGEALTAMWIEMPPTSPEWAAVRDRLLRATNRDSKP